MNEPIYKLLWIHTLDLQQIKTWDRCLGILLFLQYRFELWGTVFGYLRGLLHLLFLPSVLKVDRRGWDVTHCLLILILWEREKSLSLCTGFTFSHFSICANGACPQPSNTSLGTNNGNYWRQILQLPEGWPPRCQRPMLLERENAITVTCWVKLTTPAILLKKSPMFCFSLWPFLMYTHLR